MKTDTQLAAEPRRWLRGLKEPDVREECRDQLEEWLAEEAWDEEQLRVTMRLWRKVVGSASR